MSYLPDTILDHLRKVTDRPDVSGTRYVLQEAIGRGGMGTVYAAHDSALNRRVALKVLDAGVAEEARIAANLEHPGIVPIYDTGILPDGRVYYAMKLVEGLRLDQFRDRTPSLAARLRVFQKICEAVAFAHSRGVIHRDLKPANIMTGSFGEVLTLDWGVARTAATAEPLGTIVGTQSYTAPEQAAGTEHDHRADIYSLGAILHFLAPDPPRPVGAIAQRAMAARPEVRYPSALDLSIDVEQYLENLPVSAYRESLPERARRFSTRNATLMLLLAAYVAVRVIFLVLR